MLCFNILYSRNLWRQSGNPQQSNYSRLQTYERKPSILCGTGMFETTLFLNVKINITSKTIYIVITSILSILLLKKIRMLWSSQCMRNFFSANIAFADHIILHKLWRHKLQQWFFKVTTKGVFTAVVALASNILSLCAFEFSALKIK